MLFSVNTERFKISFFLNISMWQKIERKANKGIDKSKKTKTANNNNNNNDNNNKRKHSSETRARTIKIH